MSFIYEPKNDSVYKFPILDTDGIIGAYDWRYLMDIYVANNGRSGVSKSKLKKQLNEFLQMVEEDVYDTFDLVADGMVEQIRKEK